MPRRSLAPAFYIEPISVKDGISLLDLAPGGDDWKERFASTHDEVCTLTMYGGRKDVWSAGLKRRAAPHRIVSLTVV